MRTRINKRLISCLLSLMIAFSAFAAAGVTVYAGEEILHAAAPISGHLINKATNLAVLNLEWEFDNNTITLTLKDPIDDAVDYIFSTNETETKQIKTNATKVIVSSGTVIPHGLFQDFQKLEKVEVKCTTLEEIGNEVFSGCQSLTSVILAPSKPSLKKIGDKVFYMCKALKSISIPDNVEHIGDQAFFLSGIEQAELPANLDYLGESAFRATPLKSIKLPDKMRKVTGNTFYACRELTTVDLGSGMEEISVTAFIDCQKLTEIKNTSHLKRLENGAFRDCYSLKSLDLSSVEQMGDLAVAGCSSLSEIIISNKLKSVSSIAFLNNYADKTVTFKGTKAEFDKIVSESPEKNVDLLSGKVKGNDFTLPEVKEPETPETKAPETPETKAPEAPETDTDPRQKVEALEAQILASATAQDMPGADFNTMRARAVKAKKMMIPLTWRAVDGASGYLIYGGPRTGAYEKLGDVTGTAFTAVNLTPNLYYKFIVVAYTKSGSAAPRVLAVSKTIIAATRGGKFRNASAVKINKKNVKLKAGKSIKLKGSVTSKSKMGKKYRKFRNVLFESSDPSVATVGPKGKVKAVSPGVCFIVAYAQDGTFKQIKVTVR